ncbi:winged helix-turn-helix transcriptional regulator [Staphylococcus equorum]|nr:winged helix-turn-helix transcriptional regulator [Staphylococcus equorum]
MFLTVYPEVPTKVINALIEKGKALIPIIDMMENYGEKYGEQSNAKENQ